MFHHAKNGTLRLGTRTMDYISYGSGPDIIIMIPGLGDGLRTVKGTAAGFALLYDDFAKNHTVYAFSRVNELEEGYTTEKMAEDLVLAMDSLRQRGVWSVQDLLTRSGSGEPVCACPG